MTRWLLVLATLPACTVFRAPDDSPTAVFDSLWSDFDERYGGFISRDVDWDAARETLRPRVHDDMTDEELTGVLIELLDPLDDGHVFLATSTMDDFWESWDAPRPQGEDFDPIVIESSVLTEVGGIEDDLTWGMAAADIGYVRIHHFEVEDAVAGIAAAREALPAAHAWIVDIRDNPGGYDSTAAELAGCFATEPTPFLTIRLRNGPAHDDFTDPIRWTLEPEPDCALDGPVVLLSNAFSVSAAETFALGMVEQPRVQHVGEATQGAFSDVVLRELPNGWVYGLAIGDWRDGHDVSHEGVGVVPTVEVINSPEASAEGRDEAIERAVQVLSEG